MSQEDLWKPNEKQAQFLAIPDTIKEASYLGGAGSGKSDVLLYFPIVRRWHENPKFKQVFLRRTYPEIRDEIVPRSKQIYRKFGAEYNVASATWTFPSGAMVIFGHCEHEDDVHRYDSMEINLFTPDEITSFTESIYLYIGFTRVRSSTRDLPALIRSAGMPGNIGHTWVKKRFVDPFPKGNVIIKGRAGVKRVFIHATQADNPHIDPTYKQSLQALPEAERKAKLQGDFDAYVGQVFSEFRSKRYATEPENALHTVEPFDIPQYWPKIVIGDWGHKAMTYIAYGAISPSKRIYVYREQAWRGKKIAEWAPFIKPYLEREQPKIIKFCRSAGNDLGQDHTIQQQISNELGYQVDLTSNVKGSRISLKMLLHEYLRWQQKHIPEKEKLIYDHEKAAWILRNKGVEGYKAYNLLFEDQKPEDNLPKLQIFCCSEERHDNHPNCCPEIVNALKSCIYDKNADGTPAEDVAAFDGDDPYDVARYLCDEADRFFADAQKEFSKFQAQEAITKEFQSTGDWNLLHSRARVMESRERKLGVRRYAHR